MTVYQTHTDEWHFKYSTKVQETNDFDVFDHSTKEIAQNGQVWLARKINMKKVFFFIVVRSQEFLNVKLLSKGLNEVYEPD